MSTGGSLQNVDLTAIIDRIAAGEYASHIARSLGVAPQSLHERIRDHPGYRTAMEIRHMLKLDNAEEQLAAAPDLARARELFRAAAWRAERECRQIWGNSTALTGADGGPIQVQVVRFSGQIVDGESTRQTAAVLELGKGLNGPVDPQSSST